MTFIMSEFLWVKPRCIFSGCLWFRVPHRWCLGCSHLKAPLGERSASRFTSWLLRGLSHHWLLPSSFHVNLFIKQLQHDSRLPSEQASKTVKEVKRQKPQSFWNIISEVSPIKWKLLDPVHTQRKKITCDMEESEGAILEAVYHR